MDATRRELRLADPERLSESSWVARGNDAKPEPVEVRGAALLELASAYDTATVELAEVVGWEAVVRVEETRFVASMFADAARMLWSLVQLESQVAAATAIQAEAARQLQALNDRKSPEAVALEKRLASQMTVIREQLHRQEKRFETLRQGCRRAVTARDEETRQAQKRAQDKQTMSEVEQTLKSLRDIANSSAGIVRAARASEADDDFGQASSPA